MSCLLLSVSSAQALPYFCPPCGQEAVNIPSPGYSPCLVQPVENYLASAGPPIICPIANGFYIGTGFGYGEVDYDLNISGITLSESTNSYITENVGIGYIYSGPRFFFAAELAYNYRSSTSPIYYTDPSTLVSFTFDDMGDPPDLLTGVIVTPCDVRLDINSHNSGTFDLMPGFAFTPRLAFYGRVGLEVTSYSWERHICLPDVTIFDLGPGIGTNILQVFDEEFSDEVTDTVLGFRLGAGVTYAAGPHVSFNVNYIHTFPENATFTPNTSVINAMASNNPIIITNIGIGGTVNLVNLDTLTFNNTIKPTRNEITLGVRFTF